METVWTFEVGSILVRLICTPDYSYQYDGDDEDGETQAGLDNNELIAFDSDARATIAAQQVGSMIAPRNFRMGGKRYTVRPSTDCLPLYQRLHIAATLADARAFAALIRKA
jgi:hypothetical protein